MEEGLGVEGCEVGEDGGDVGGGGGGAALVWGAEVLLGQFFNGAVHACFDAFALGVVFEDCGGGFQGCGRVDGSFSCEVVGGAVDGLVLD